MHLGDTASGLPRWIGARVEYEWPSVYATTCTRAHDGALNVTLRVHIPPIRGALYRAWLLLAGKAS
ncbi:hypothetical protein [Streptomyces nymphaeiformis]|jgi:hypothetical protein|uniref:Uncharacterized protein n=1 Tax=Streptomyces nymphaeiformis TaxID=2663842 RepID=A0A7W7XHE6_9ACTN|nr:hypothetical protein [Streptomyces nymphaeiformis]MBB4987481.1 hypothetical protein [Streptomyces nymphaeiformis]